MRRLALVAVFILIAVWSSGGPVWAGTLVLPTTSDGYLETFGTSSNFSNGTGPFGDFYEILSDQRSSGSSGVAGLDFDLSFIPAGTTITAARLNLVVAGTLQITSQPNLSALKFIDSDHTIEKADLSAFPSVSLSGDFPGLPSNAPFGTVNLPKSLDVTSFIQSVVNSGTPNAGFELASSQSLVYVMGSRSGATAPTLTITSPASLAVPVPEPASLLMLGSGMAGVAVMAWCRPRASGRL